MIGKVFMSTTAWDPKKIDRLLKKMLTVVYLMSCFSYKQFLA